MCGPATARGSARHPASSESCGGAAAGPPRAPSPHLPRDRHQARCRRGAGPLVQGPQRQVGPADAGRSESASESESAARAPAHGLRGSDTVTATAKGPSRRGRSLPMLAASSSLVRSSTLSPPGTLCRTGLRSRCARAPSGRESILRIRRAGRESILRAGGSPQVPPRRAGHEGRRDVGRRPGSRRHD